MKFRATGRDRSSGQPIEMVFEAADAQSAFASAQARGIVVDAMNPVSAAPPPIYQHPPQQYAPQAPPPPAKKNVRGWAVLLVAAAFIGSIFEPTIGFVFFGVLVLLMLLYMVPGMQGMSRALLGLSIGRPVATTMKMIFVAGLAFVLLIASIAARSAKADRDAAEAARVAAEAEQQRLVAEGNAKVDGLMADAKRRMDARDVAGASAKLAEVMKVEHAGNKGPAQRLNENIALARDEKAVRARLVDLSDEDFDAFASSGKVPGVFNLGYPVLNDAVVGLARPMVPDVKIERAALAKKRAEEAEQRRKDELARAEAERKERERKTAAEAAAKAAAQAEIKEKLDAYMAVLKLDDFASEIVASVGVERRGDTWTATIKVRNLWHLRNKQLRFQDAQNLWQAWAVLASPKDPDNARIKLVDLNGNEVGGSRVLGGSLIWVQD